MTNTQQNLGEILFWPFHYWRDSKILTTTSLALTGGFASGGYFALSHKAPAWLFLSGACLAGHLLVGWGLNWCGRRLEEVNIDLSKGRPSPEMFE